MLLLALKAASLAGRAVGAFSCEGGAGSKDEAVLWVLQVGEPGAGWGLQAHTVHTPPLLQGCQINLNKIKLKSISIVNTKHAYDITVKPGFQSVSERI